MIWDRGVPSSLPFSLVEEPVYDDSPSPVTKTYTNYYCGGVYCHCRLVSVPLIIYYDIQEYTVVTRITKQAYNIVTCKMG